MVSREPDAAETMRLRLQTDLRLAIRARARFDMSVLRVLIAAIDNAGAIDLTKSPAARQCEAERRHLSLADVHAILTNEHVARREAADVFARLGRSMESTQAIREMEFVSRYLPSQCKIVNGTR
jgi:uncharacterized protein YqeY